jgi:hypothetical protein
MELLFLKTVSLLSFQIFQNIPSWPMLFLFRGRHGQCEATKIGRLGRNGMVTRTENNLHFTH